MTNDVKRVYQHGTLALLIPGLFTGTMTVAELLTHGNFGIGTARFSWRTGLIRWPCPYCEWDEKVANSHLMRQFHCDSALARSSYLRKRFINAQGWVKRKFSASTVKACFAVKWLGLSKSCIPGRQTQQEPYQVTAATRVQPGLNKQT